MRSLPLPDSTYWLFAAEQHLVAVSGAKAKQIHSVDREGTALVRRGTFGETVTDRPLALVGEDLICEIAQEIVAVPLGGGERGILVPRDKRARRKSVVGRIEAATAAGGGVVVAWSFDDENIEWTWLDPASGEVRRLSKTALQRKEMLARWCCGNARTATWLEHHEDADRPATPSYELVRWHAASDEIERSPLALKDVRALRVCDGVTYLGAASKEPGDESACVYACYGSAVELIARLPEGSIETICTVDERFFAIHSSGSRGQDQLYAFGPAADDPTVSLFQADKGYQLRALVTRDGELYWLDRLNMMSPPRKPRPVPDRLLALERVTVVPRSR
jgi:hypothetical protein